ncbi:MAG: 16S rRNA (cytosine(967)-C(5))-methyltransferase RsmB [Rhodospirillales bacterium]|nr:16S rRNA (cytosine(967)-C(5))-methyltransferase RsmB [Rhodospirillales bacterium]
MISVLRQRLTLDDAMERHGGYDLLSPRDRSFAHNLVLTTLRRLGQIDDIVKHCLTRPLGSEASVVQDILRLGICQLLFLDTAPHAAVNTSVSLVKSRRRGGHAGLINAVLRRIAREGTDWLNKQDAARLNTPKWLWKAWSAAYGQDECKRIAEANLGRPPLDLSVKSKADIWSRTLNAALLPNGTIRLEGSGKIQDLPGFDQGEWWVQDVAAAMPVRLFRELKGVVVADLCAAPGGKTAQLAAAGADVIAVDQSKDRLSRLRENLERLGLAAQVVRSDATVWRPDRQVDAVLVDAPCSATGTLRRHPDATWLRRPEDLESLTDLQDRLLLAAVEMVKPGGTIIYCTCSLQPEEGAQRIERLIEIGTPVERDVILPGELYQLEDAITADGDLRTFPFHWGDRGGMDGFFAARLRRL